MYPGSNWDIINTSVVAGSDTEITYPKPVRSFYHLSRGNVTLQLRKTNNATPFLTILPGEKPSWDVVFSSNGTTSLGFVRTEAGTDTVETVVTF